MINETTLFYPKTAKDLRVQYPELTRIKEFNDNINPKQLLFVWWFKNPTSPLVLDENLTGAQRLTAAIVRSFGENAPEMQSYTANGFPENVRIALARMEKFNVQIRSKAKKMFEQMFDNLQKLSNAKIEDFQQFVENKTTGDMESAGVDWSGRKSYISSCKDIIDITPDLIKTLEEGFGIDDNGKETVSTKAIDRHVKYKQDINK